MAVVCGTLVRRVVRYIGIGGLGSVGVIGKLRCPGRLKNAPWLFLNIISESTRNCTFLSRAVETPGLYIFCTV
jgi:hypothetical protein